ncbi:unnamed protein product [Zymoseptoria tritici ST99CH_3D1]|nr:unnamed protein product [Zymoseptoria tritici ST99CH_3D1]
MPPKKRPEYHRVGNIPAEDKIVPQGSEALDLHYRVIATISSNGAVRYYGVDTWTLWRTCVGAYGSLEPLPDIYNLLQPINPDPYFRRALAGRTLHDRVREWNGLTDDEKNARKRPAPPRRPRARSAPLWPQDAIVPFAAPPAGTGDNSRADIGAVITFVNKAVNKNLKFPQNEQAALDWDETHTSFLAFIKTIVIPDPTPALPNRTTTLGRLLTDANSSFKFWAALEIWVLPRGRNDLVQWTQGSNLIARDFLQTPQPGNNPTHRVLFVEVRIVKDPDWKAKDIAYKQSGSAAAGHRRYPSRQVQKAVDEEDGEEDEEAVEPEEEAEEGEEALGAQDDNNQGDDEQDHDPPPPAGNAERDPEDGDDAQEPQEPRQSDVGGPGARLYGVIAQAAGPSSGSPDGETREAARPAGRVTRSNTRRQSPVVEQEEEEDGGDDLDGPDEQEDGQGLDDDGAPPAGGSSGAGDDESPDAPDWQDPSNFAAFASNIARTGVVPSAGTPRTQTRPAAPASGGRTTRSMANRQESVERPGEVDEDQEGQEEEDGPDDQDDPADQDGLNDLNGPDDPVEDDNNVDDNSGNPPPPRPAQATWGILDNSARGIGRQTAGRRPIRRRPTRSPSIEPGSELIRMVAPGMPALMASPPRRAAPATSARPGRAAATSRSTRMTQPESEDDAQDSDASLGKRKRRGGGSRRKSKTPAPAGKARKAAASNRMAGSEDGEESQDSDEPLRKRQRQEENPRRKRKRQPTAKASKKATTEPEDEEEADDSDGPRQKRPRRAKKTREKSKSPPAEESPEKSPELSPRSKKRRRDNRNGQRFF